MKILNETKKSMTEKPPLHIRMMDIIKCFMLDINFVLIRNFILENNLLVDIIDFFYVVIIYCIG